MKGLKTPGSCLTKLRACASDGPQAKERIARFILKSPEDARSLSIDDLATRCRASAASISRFAKSLGYGSFKEFQVDLSAAVAQEGDSLLDVFSEDARPRAIVRRVFEANRRSLIETEQLADTGTLLRIARRIERSRRVFLLGIGGSAQVARDAAQRLLSLGFTAVVLQDPYDVIFATGNAGPGDIVWGISHTGETAPVVEAVRHARRRGAVTIALTNYPHSTLAAASEYALITAYREHRVNAAVSSSRIAQMCLIDCVYFILGGRSRRHSIQVAEDAEQRTRTTLRVGRPSQHHLSNGRD